MGVPLFSADGGSMEELDSSCCRRSAEVDGGDGGARIATSDWLEFSDLE